MGGKIRESPGERGRPEKSIHKDVFYTVGSILGVVAAVLSAWNFSRDLVMRERRDYDETTAALDRIELQLGGDGKLYIPACVGRPNALLHKSLLELDLILARDPIRLQAMLYRGLSLFCLGEREQALAYFRGEILLRHPDSPDARIYFGMLYFRAGMFESAEKLLKQGLELSPRKADALMTLGLSYSAAGRPKEAEAILRKLLEVDPYFPGAYTELAAVLRVQAKKVKDSEGGWRLDETSEAMVGEARDLIKKEEEVLKAQESDPTQRRAQRRKEISEQLDELENR